MKICKMNTNERIIAKMVVENIKGRKMKIRKKNKKMDDKIFYSIYYIIIFLLNIQVFIVYILNFPCHFYFWIMPIVDK